MEFLELLSEFREGSTLSLLVLEVLQALGEEQVLHLEAFLDDVDLIDKGVKSKITEESPIDQGKNAKRFLNSFGNYSIVLS